MVCWVPGQGSVKNMQLSFCVCISVMRQQVFQNNGTEVFIHELLAICPSFFSLKM